MPDVLGVSDLFYAAAVGEACWGDAIGALATLTGSLSGELLGFGRAETMEFYCRNVFSAAEHADFVALGGYDPSVNSRMRVSMASAPLRILDERDFTTARDIASNPDYGAFLRKTDLVNLCAVNLLSEDGLTVGLSVLRTTAQGNIPDDDRAAFAAIVPHARAAMRIHLMLERRASALMADTLERVAACAFICDTRGRLLGATTAAEAILSEGTWLTTRDGVLTTSAPRETRRLHRAIHAAAIARTSGSAPPPEFGIRDASGKLLMLEAMPHTDPRALRGAALVVLIARPARDIGAAAEAIGRVVFQLTDREAAIASALVRGRTPDDIARETGIALGTVRVHLRNIFDKVDVRSQAQLVAKLCAHC